MSTSLGTRWPTEERQHVYEHQHVLDAAERLWSRVDKTGECWLWLGARGGGGRYGTISIAGHMRPAHRIAFESVHGLVPTASELDHLCREPLCVRPSHLEVVSHAENMRRIRKARCEVHQVDLPLTGPRRRCHVCDAGYSRAYRARRRAAA